MVLRSRAMLAALAITLAAGSLVAVDQPSNTAEAGGGGCHGDRPKTDVRTTTVLLQENCMSPTIARMDPGDEVTFVNKDAAPHTVTGANMLWGTGTGMAQGDEVTHEFHDEGVYPYYCLFHPGMAGAIVVGDGAGESSGVGAVSPSSLSPASSRPQRSGAEPAALAQTPGDSTHWRSIVSATVIALVASCAIVVAVRGRSPRRPRAPS